MADTTGINLAWSNYIKDRDEGFEELYNLYYETLLSYCLGKLRHLDLAENAVADVFIKVLRFENIEEIKNPDGWIFTLVKNHCLSYWNKQNRRTQILAEVLSPSLNLISQQIELQIDVVAIEDLIKERLDKKDFLIWQFHLDGFANDEIAEKVGLSSKTISNRKTIIRDNIRIVLKKEVGYEKE